MDLNSLTPGMSMPYQQPILFGRKVDNNQPNAQANSGKSSDTSPKSQSTLWKMIKYGKIAAVSLLWASFFGGGIVNNIRNNKPINQAQEKLIKEFEAMQTVTKENPSYPPHINNSLNETSIKVVFPYYLEKVSSTIAQTNNPEAALKAEMENLPLEKVESEKVLKFYRNAVKSGAFNNPEACLNQFIDEFLADRMNPQTIQQIKAEVKEFNAKRQKFNANTKTIDNVFLISFILTIIAIVGFSTVLNNKIADATDSNDPQPKDM